MPARAALLAAVALGLLLASSPAVPAVPRSLRHATMTMTMKPIMMTIAPEVRVCRVALVRSKLEEQIRQRGQEQRRQRGRRNRGHCC